MMSVTMRNSGVIQLRPSIRCHYFDKKSIVSNIGNTAHSNGKIFESMADAISDIRDGSSLMFGGFGTCGSPEKLIKAIFMKGCKDLVVICNNLNKYSLGILLRENRIKRVTASFIGDNADLVKQYLNGQMTMELSPQGTLAERIRAAGAGIPAFYTPTGFGTAIQDGQFVVKYDNAGNPEIFDVPKNIRRINGRNCVLETALTGDFAIIKAWKADKAGNLIFRKSARNFNPIMCKAAKVTIVEAEEILEVGQLDPDQIHVPGIYVDRIVQSSAYERGDQPEKIGEKSTSTLFSAARSRIIKRAVLEFKDGMYVNLGIGIPMMVANLIPQNINVMIQSENGILGVGPHALEDQMDVDLVNAGNEKTTVVPGAAFFGSDESFAMIRGGHLDMTILGGMEVSKKGDLANWMVPGRMISGMGGAMDLVSAPKTKVVVTMEHKARDGSPKILADCTLPITGKQCVDLIITDLAVFEVRKGSGLKLVEIAPNSNIIEIRSSTACDFEVSNDLKVMGQAEVDAEGN